MMLLLAHSHSHEDTAQLIRANYEQEVNTLSPETTISAIPEAVSPGLTWPPRCDIYDIYLYIFNVKYRGSNPLTSSTIDNVWCHGAKVIWGGMLLISLRKCGVAPPAVTSCCTSSSSLLTFVTFLLQEDTVDWWFK